MKEMREMDKALQTYEERFGERFPTEAMGLAGEAAKLDYDPTADY